MNQENEETIWDYIVFKHNDNLREGTSFMKLVFDLSWNLLNISHITNAQVTTFPPWNHASLRICPLLTTMPDAWQVFIISHLLRECSLAYGWLLICMYLKLLCLDCLEMSLNTVF